MYLDLISLILNRKACGQNPFKQLLLRNQRANAVAKLYMETISTDVCISAANICVHVGKVKVY